MITLSLSHEKRARVWFGDLDPAEPEIVSIRRSTIIPRVQLGQCATQSVAVEIFVPAGPRFEYALLGATVVRTAGDAEGLNVEVPENDPRGPVFPDSLAGRLDDVRWGLPAEYARAVLENVEAELLVGAPAGGLVRISCAAHGLVGSSSQRFGRVARAVVRLLVRTEADPREILEEM